MKQYTGTKTVLAEPMTESEAIDHGFARFQEGNREMRQGYHVVYNNPDGTTYDSWSPADVFESSYKPSSNFIERMEIERDELIERIFKAQRYLFCSRSITSQEKLPLHRQVEAMQNYCSWLCERINLAKHQSEQQPGCSCSVNAEGEKESSYRIKNKKDLNDGTVD